RSRAAGPYRGEQARPGHVLPGRGCCALVGRDGPHRPAARASGPAYCGVSPAAFTTSAHLVRLSCTILRNASGDDTWIMLPVDVSRFSTSGCCSALAAAALIFWTSAGSMPLGPKRPNQM